MLNLFFFSLKKSDKKSALFSERAGEECHSFFLQGAKWEWHSFFLTRSGSGAGAERHSKKTEALITMELLIIICISDDFDCMCLYFKTTKGVLRNCVVLPKWLGLSDQNIFWEDILFCFWWPNCTL